MPKSSVIRVFMKAVRPLSRCGGARLEINYLRNLKEFAPKTDRASKIFTKHLIVEQRARRQEALQRRLGHHLRKGTALGSVIIGSGKSLPARVVTNDELSRIVDTTDEWIVPRTGIRTRHIAIEETCTDLGTQAALRALGAEPGGWQRETETIDAASLDMIICPTLTADTHFPSEAALIRERIGAVNAVCYDVSCACSGCVYGLSVADLIMAGAAADRARAEKTGRPMARNNVRRVLVVATERLSKLIDWTERATCILFGDGAGAVVLEWRDDDNVDAPGILSSYMENTDDEDRTLWCDSAFVTREVPFAASNEEGDPYMRMAGQAVFKFATSAMVRCTDEALARAGLAVGDVDLFTPHQANERIIRYAAKKMGLPMERFQVIIDHVGNVSGASALIALNEALIEGKLHPGNIACMTAFGGGLTAGSCVIRI